MKRLKTYILLFMLFPFVAMAQKEKKKVRSIQLRIACLEILEPFSQIVLPGHNGNIQLNERYPTDQLNLKVTAGEPLRIYARNTKVNEPSQSIGRVTLPLQARRGIVLLYPHKNTYRGLFIEDSKFPTGSVYIRNFSPNRIRIEFDGVKKVKIPSKRSLVYKGATASSKSVKVQISVLEETKKWKLISSSSWRLVPSRRELVILFKKPGSNTISIKGITQFGEPSTTK